MRSALSLRSRLPLRSSSLQPRSFLFHSHLLWTPKRQSLRLQSTRRRLLSSKAEADDESPSISSLPPPSSGEPEPPKRSARTKEPTSEPLEFPPDLDILWTPEDKSATSPPEILPPLEMFDKILSSLHICLHPQTQHRAVYPSSVGLVEPTLALYCPIEGGDYVIDATVMELARRTGSEVVVLDAIQLAAGEWGAFGKAASVLQLPRNPLHFSSWQPENIEDAVEEDEGPARQVTFTLVPPPSFPSNLLSSTAVVTAKRSSTTRSKVKQLFDSLINVSHDQNGTQRPRIVYLRDFPTLAPTSPSWYPHLLAAVRERRRGPLSRPSSPVHSPMVVVFGITPPLTSQSASAPGPTNGLVNLLLNRLQSSQMVSAPKLGKSDWGESDAAEKQRAKRLHDRLKKWESGDSSLLDEVPKLSVNEESDSRQKPEVLFFGQPVAELSLGGRSPDPDASTFFRTCMLVPSSRSLELERECRVARRREINELTMRMAVGTVGGIIDEPLPDPIIEATGAEDKSFQSAELSHPSLSDARKMWDSWGRHIEEWSSVKQVADHAVGSVVASFVMAGAPVTKVSLELTRVPWSTVEKQWVAHHSSREMKRLWMKEALPSGKLKEQEQKSEGQLQADVDEVVERLRNDGDLDPHEQRLLPCIVDAASMPTSFSQVHLPAHTIDSVRTIVSLPLLHPQAFQQGVLKDHGMTGCLLFGPPGVGKTLVVRALAKEAGCRMMVITPADVMDMYVGEGEKLVKAVFSLARKLSPCVIFLDEIDALFGARMSSRESGGAVAHRGVITEFMQEMDGLKSSREDNVIVIGATNRPFDLDDAVLRRLPRRLLVDLPGSKEREEILKIHLRDEVLASDVDVRVLAQRTDSFSGSDLKYLCVSAALHAVKEHVQLPWALTTGDSAANKHVTSTDEAISSGSRILTSSHFAQAFKEITPSSSETLGSLADLRRWNEEFGEGRKDKRKRVIWGKGRFGFNEQGLVDGEDGRVMPAATNLASRKSTGET